MNEEEIKQIISKMSIEQKIGAVFTFGFNGTVITPKHIEAIEKFHCGGLRITPNGRSFGSYVDPKSKRTVVKIDEGRIFYKNDNPPVVSARQFSEIFDKLQAIAKKRPLGLPLHFSYDQESGSGNVPFSGVKTFPPFMGLKATDNIEIARKAALYQGKQSRAIGYHICHSPVVDVNTNSVNPEINTRSFSDRAEEVAAWAAESCKGYKEAGIVATAKHFPGRGDSDTDAHYSVPVINVDKKTLFERELLPYRLLIEQVDLPSIMTAHSMYPQIDPDTISTVSKKIVTGILRDELGFDGVITTDSMTMGALAERYGVPDACARALVAGSDLILMKAQNNLIDASCSTVMEYLDAGTLTEKDLDEKIFRILRMKSNYGIFGKTSDIDEFEKLSKDKELIELVSETARCTTQLVKNEADVLPLKKDSKVLIIEQTAANTNTLEEHNGIFFESCMQYTNDITYLEVGSTYDDGDIEQIRNAVTGYDTILVTNFFNYRRGQNTWLIEELCALKDKNIILIANTPYKISIPKNSETIVITYGYSRESMEAAAGTIFGTVEPGAITPVSNA